MTSTARSSSTTWSTCTRREAEKTAANPDAVAKIRADTIKECEARWSKTPPTEADKVAARCSMKAQTTGELEACGS